MPSLSAVGRVAIAKIVFERALHLAWGTGDGEWTTAVPAETGLETALRAEIGRRQATVVSYCVPDSAGAIVLPEGSFTLTTAATRHLYVRTDFSYLEATGAAIREIGLFSATVTAPGLPANQRYFTPDQITDPGTILHLKNYSPIYRFPNTRERFEIVLTF